MVLSHDYYLTQCFLLEFLVFFAQCGYCIMVLEVWYQKSRSEEKIETKKKKSESERKREKGRERGENQEIGITWDKVELEE